jgi:molecular chaperone HtpG
MHLHGVIDSPDIPLNFSRSYLQNDSNVKKISSYIVKKVAEKLEQTFNNNREDFEKKWDDIKFFVSFGMITNEKFYEKAEKFFLFKNIDNKFFSWEEYSNKIKDLQTNKDKKIVVLYSNNPDIQASYIDSAKELGYDVLHFPHPIDVHLISKLESKLENVQIVRIDSDVITKLIQKDDNQISKLNDTDKENIKKTFEKVVTDKAFTIVFESLGEKDLPILIVQNEAMRRMKEMSETSGGGGIYGNFPNMYNLVLNTNHPVYTKMLNETDETVKENKAEYLKNLALISQNLLKGDDLKKFINSTVNLI